MLVRVGLGACDRCGPCGSSSARGGCTWVPLGALPWLVPLLVAGRLRRHGRHLGLESLDWWIDNRRGAGRGPTTESDRRPAGKTSGDIPPSPGGREGNRPAAGTSPEGHPRVGPPLTTGALIPARSTNVGPVNRTPGSVCEDGGDTRMWFRSVGRRPVTPGISDAEPGLAAHRARSTSWDSTAFDLPPSGHRPPEARTPPGNRSGHSRRPSRRAATLGLPRQWSAPSRNALGGPGDDGARHQSPGCTAAEPRFEGGHPRHGHHPASGDVHDTAAHPEPRPSARGRSGAGEKQFRRRIVEPEASGIVPEGSM